LTTIYTSMDASVWDKGWGKVERKAEPDDKAEKGLCKIISITNLIMLNSFVVAPTTN